MQRRGEVPDRDKLKREGDRVERKRLRRERQTHSHGEREREEGGNKVSFDG